MAEEIGIACQGVILSFLNSKGCNRMFTLNDLLQVMRMMLSGPGCSVACHPMPSLSFARPIMTAA
jgi:hypothetical protein